MPPRQRMTPLGKCWQIPFSLAPEIHVRSTTFGGTCHTKHVPIWGIRDIRGPEAVPHSCQINQNQKRRFLAEIVKHFHSQSQWPVVQLGRRDKQERETMDGKCIGSSQVGVYVYAPPKFISPEYCLVDLSGAQQEPAQERCGFCCYQSTTRHIRPVSKAGFSVYKLSLLVSFDSYGHM